ncbi:MAG: prephenate dehydrogenase [Bacteroidetes bacterium]|nr:prephenate dehydrogenase [Bacteroidota bacterium]
MRIFIAGLGKMGAWLCRELSKEHQILATDTDPSKRLDLPGMDWLSDKEQMQSFSPELFINAASLQHTVKVFDTWLPWLPEQCILSDIASVKNGLEAYYNQKRRPFVSVHPMFGPTFANLNQLKGYHAILISQSCGQGKDLFRQFFQKFGLQVHELSFDGHDRTTAYSLSVPFVSSLVFGACMRPQPAPGTTFSKHLAIARGLMDEDDQLLSEILFNPHTLPMLEEVIRSMQNLQHMLQNRDRSALQDFLHQVRVNVKNAGSN